MINISYISTYYNYHFKDSGLHKINQKIDKLLYLTGNYSSDKIQKIKYQPEYRSLEKRTWSTEILRNFGGNIVRSFLEKDFPEYYYNNDKVFNHMRSLYSLASNEDIVYTSIINNFLYNYNEIFVNGLLDNDPKNKSKLYRSIKIPKRKVVNGVQQYRQLHEPIPALKNLQTQAKFIIENILRITPHNVAHAYFKNRDNVTNAESHKYSKHIINIDLKDFFPNITGELIKNSLIHFKEFNLMQIPEEDLLKELEIENSQNFTHRNTKRALTVRNLQKELLNAIIDIATYNNSLPQGSPLSPLLSNLVMFRFDHHMQKELDNNKDYFSKTTVVYTRYADDLTFSSMYPINLKRIMQNVESRLKLYTNDQLKINPNKVKYLKTNHRCYVTGVKINKDKNATYGHEKKAELKRELFKLFMLYQKNEKDTKEAQEIIGKLSYLQRIEPQYASNLIDKYCKKFNVPTKQFYQYFLK